MKALKNIAFALASAMCLTVLASCADSGDTAVTRPPDEVNATASDDFVSADYNKDPFTILVIKHTDTIKDYYGGDFIDADSYNGGTINDAVYERNMTVEEKYNTIVEQRVEISGDPASVLQTFYMSGDFCFDAIYGWGYKLGSCITENYFANFYDLPNIDLTKEYWSPSAMDDMTVDGKLYVCINDISMNKLEWAGLLFFNKQLVEDYNLDSEFGSPYDMVNNGTWTLDTYLAMVQSISNDVNGDGVISKDDVYGLVDGDSSGADLAHSCGIYYTSKNDDGSYSLDFYGEKLLGIINKVHNVYSNTNYVKNYGEMWENADTSAYDDQWEYARSFFATDHSLFCTGSAYITGEFRNMESEYGILPMPKYDTAQKDYVSDVSTIASLFAIPATTRNDVESAGSERTGTILEYMAYQSNQILLPKYYESVLKGQRLNADEDQQMLDIIRNTVRYEFTSMVGISDIGDIVNAMFVKPTTASSTFSRNQNKLTKELDTFYTDVLLLDTKGASNEK